jgi:hypothetical protein
VRAKDTAEKPAKPRARKISFAQSAVVPIDSDLPLDTTALDDELEFCRHSDLSPTTD